jgi:nitroreductase
MGHIGQNIFLQSQALGLEAGIVGAFNDRAVADAVGVGKNHEPLVILPVGWKG